VSNVWTGEGPRHRRSSDKVRVTLVIAMLVLAEFYLLPSLVAGRAMPDLLLLALLLFCLRVSPGMAAVVGLLVGLVIDVLTPARFGANMLAHVLLGWGAAWGRAVFFADNIAVNAGLFFVGTWVRNILVLLLSGTSLALLGTEAFFWSPLQGLTTALVGIVVVILFRDWLAIRIER
jgi:rod shape-determining protein MreD